MENIFGNSANFVLFGAPKNEQDIAKKLPINRLGSLINAFKESNWRTYDDALEQANKSPHAAGVSLVLTKNDAFFCVDLDGCLDENGVANTTALEFIDTFKGAYVERSMSGRGLHIIGSAPQPPLHSCKNAAIAGELYTSNHTISLTFDPYFEELGDPEVDLQKQLETVVERYFKPHIPAPRGETSEEVVLLGDDELIRRALKSSSSSVFDGRATFAQLWNADVEALSKAYPVSSNDPLIRYDASSADLALAQHLSFWTGKNASRIKDLMCKSALIRDKWSREDYLPRTIEKAIANTSSVYTAQKTNNSLTKKLPEQAISAAPTLRFLPATAQVEYFKGCTYVLDFDKILLPNGRLVKQSQFDNYFGGYLFQLDASGDKTTRKAWEAFLHSQVNNPSRVESTCFNPRLRPHEVVERPDGTRAINTYVPLDIPSSPGSVDLFLKHLKLLLPDGRDQIILLGYLASIVQNQGVKFTWAVLLQGVEGNGKTLFTKVVENAIGSRYTHYVNPRQLGNEFNGWLANNLLYAVEDIHVPGHRRDVMEALKPMITGGAIAIENKGVDAVTSEICGNFIFNSNHKDALLKHKDDRRYCVFFCAQQSVEDLNNQGLTDAYFKELYGWLNSGGYANVTHFLKNYDIPDEFNPATGCFRAPDTSSTIESVEASLSLAAQEILEAVEEARQGFCGDWISSIAVDMLINGLPAYARVSPRNRKQLLESIGYVHHPILNNGRATRALPCDGGKKPTLYVRKDSVSYTLDNADSVFNAYQTAQDSAVSSVFSGAKL